MSDVTVGVGIDATAATLTLYEVMAKTDEATAKITALRRKALSVIGQVNSLVTQGYSSLKQLIERAGGIIDPFFDMAFTMISSIVTTAVSGALLLTSQVYNPVLVAAGLALMVISVELSIKTSMELAEARSKSKEFLGATQARIQPTQPTVVTSGHQGFTPRSF